MLLCPWSAKGQVSTCNASKHLSHVGHRAKLALGSCHVGRVASGAGGGCASMRGAPGLAADPAAAEADAAALLRALELRAHSRGRSDGNGPSQERNEPLRASSSASTPSSHTLGGRMELLPLWPAQCEALSGDVGHHREERPRGGPLGGFGRGGAEGAVAGDPWQRLAGLSALRHAAPLGLPPHGPQRPGPNSLRCPEQVAALRPPCAEISPHGRAALASASAMVSHCDAAEAGAARQARRGFAAGDGDTAEVEEAFALREKKMEKDCFWTVHVNRSLGGHLGELEASQAFASCAARPDCAGVMLSSSAGSLRLGEPLLESAPGLEAHVRWCLPWVATEGTEGGAGALCPFAPTVGLLGTALRRLGNGRTMEKFAPELVAQANLEVSTFSAQFGAGAAGREAWSTQWPLWKVLGQLQQRLDLLTDPIGASPGTTVLPALQHALGFDDEAWLVLLRELEESSKQAKLPTSLRERVKCMSGSSCAAEFFARLHLMLYSSDSLPLRDQIFMNNEDPLLPELMLNSKRKDFNDVKELEYDWKAIVDDVRNNRHETGETSRIDAMKALMPIDHPLQVDRMQLANFILEVKDEIVASGPMTRCLEWDQPFLLAHAFAAHCRWMDVYSYSEPHPSEPRLGLPGRQEFPSGTIHYWGDMEVPENFGVDPGTMDLILCPFVFEHVSRPWVAMRTLADSLRPGGFILWAAPMFQRYHGSPHDYYRYTPNGAKALATHAGLEVVRLYSPGDLSLVSGAPALAPR
ncbi:unnamed protein product, partial [Effrenium voratum]